MQLLLFNLDGTVYTRQDNRSTAVTSRQIVEYFNVPDSSACSSKYNTEIATILSRIAYRERIHYIPRILATLVCSFVVYVWIVHLPYE